MADTPIRKFMFDRSFDSSSDPHASPRPRQPVTLKPEQIDVLKQEAYDAGFVAGSQMAGDERTKMLKEVVVQIDEKIANVMANAETIQRNNDTQLRKAIVAALRKIVPDFAARQGLQEIQAMLASVIAEMLHEPRLVVRIHESQFDAINTHLHEITVQKAYAGKIVILADAEIALGDCRIEWADGGMERNTKAQINVIERVLTPPNDDDNLSPPSTHLTTEETSNG